MYVLGNDAELKTKAWALLRNVAASNRSIVTDAEVYQEILHRYAAIKRLEAVQPAFDLMTKYVARVFPIDLAIIEQAKEVLFSFPALSARDAVHIGVMRFHGISEVYSFDRGLDAVPDIKRISSI